MGFVTKFSFFNNKSFELYFAFLTLISIFCEFLIWLLSPKMKIFIYFVIIFSEFPYLMTNKVWLFFSSYHSWHQFSIDWRKVFFGTQYILWSFYFKKVLISWIWIKYIPWISLNEKSLFIYQIVFIGSGLDCENQFSPFVYYLWSFS